VTAEIGVFSLLSTHAPLATALGVLPAALPASIYRSGAADNPPVDHFIVIRWETPDLRGSAGLLSFTLRVHDRDNTYNRITACLDAAKAKLTGVVHEHGIAQIDWRGRSPDLFDDGYQTLTRFDTYVVVAGLRTREA
jgi:hypothetical protein